MYPRSGLQTVGRRETYPCREQGHVHYPPAHGAVAIPNGVFGSQNNYNKFNNDIIINNKDNVGKVIII
jgi:hypothetical protein